MSRRNLLCLAAVLLTSSTAIAHANTFAAECAENYSGCGGSNLPNSCDNVTSAEDNFAIFGFTRGLFFADSAAFPQDFWEAATISGGTDNIFMDASDRRIAIWSGHGTGASSEPNGSWDMAFGSPHNGACSATSPGQLVYGEGGTDGFGNDGQNFFVIADASCSMVLG